MSQIAQIYTDFIAKTCPENREAIISVNYNVICGKKFINVLSILNLKFDQL
jgi:hypothetical protein